jgi:6-pyruvoyltetrahydropterin/6-carboxytetrahydropterin synthase
LGVLRECLDHHHLDEVEGLGMPTLENLLLFIQRELANLPDLSTVSVARDSSGDRCVYEPAWVT